MTRFNQRNARRQKTRALDNIDDADQAASFFTYCFKCSVAMATSASLKISGSRRGLVIDEPVQEHHDSTHREGFGSRLSQHCFDGCGLRFALNDGCGIRRSGRDVDLLTVEVHFPHIVRLAPGLGLNDEDNRGCISPHDRHCPSRPECRAAPERRGVSNHRGSPRHPVRRPSPSLSFVRAFSFE